MQSLIEIHVARVIVLDDEGNYIGEQAIDTRTGVGGFEILKAMCDRPKSNPAYIETFYSGCPAVGRVSHKNSAFRAWEKRNGLTGYK